MMRLHTLPTPPSYNNMTIASDKELIHAWQRRRGNETNGTLRQRLSHPPDLVIAAYSRLHEAADDDDDDVDDIEDEDVDDAGIMDDALDFYADSMANTQHGMSDPSDDSDLSAECRKDFDVDFDAMLDMDILGGADFSEQVEKDISGTLHNDADWEVTSNDSDQGQHHQYLRCNKKRRKKRRPNRSYRKESVKTSGWYLHFLQPGSRFQLNVTAGSQKRAIANLRKSGGRDEPRFALKLKRNVNFNCKSRTLSIFCHYLDKHCHYLDNQNVWAFSRCVENNSGGSAHHDV
jgi:hypothetical protein